jgi:hypothetical protein
LARLRATLLLQLLRRDWGAIANTELPPELSAGEQQLAVETIDFYKALAAFQNPEGDRVGAEQMFARLHARHSTVPAYAVDLFAARISLLLGGDLFAQLHGSAMVRGRQILADAEQMMLHVRSVNATDTEIFNCNKGLLLLALGQADQANQLLNSLRAVRLRDTVAAYSAIALDRMGRVGEAVAALTQAEHGLGVTDVLVAARAHIESGKPFAAFANLSGSTGEDIASGIGSA